MIDWGTILGLNGHDVWQRYNQENPFTINHPDDTFDTETWGLEAGNAEAAELLQSGNAQMDLAKYDQMVDLKVPHVGSFNAQKFGNEDVQMEWAFGMPGFHVA